MYVLLLFVGLNGAFTDIPGPSSSAEHMHNLPHPIICPAGRQLFIRSSIKSASNSILIELVDLHAQVGVSVAQSLRFYFHDLTLLDFEGTFIPR